MLAGPEKETAKLEAGEGIEEMETGSLQHACEATGLKEI